MPVTRPRAPWLGCPTTEVLRVATYPCAKHHARYNGPAAGAYPRLVTGVDAYGAYLRLCHVCAAAYVQELADAFHEVTDDPPDEPWERSCFACPDRGDVLPLIQIYATVFPKKDDRRDFWGAVCDSHRALATDMLFLGTTPTLRAGLT